MFCGFNSEGLELRVGNRRDSWRAEQRAIRKNVISDTSVELRGMERVLK